jgi:hypothetical protein
MPIPRKSSKQRTRQLRFTMRFAKSAHRPTYSPGCFSSSSFLGKIHCAELTILFVFWSVTFKTRVCGSFISKTIAQAMAETLSGTLGHHFAKKGCSWKAKKIGAISSASAWVAGDREREGAVVEVEVEVERLVEG